MKSGFMLPVPSKCVLFRMSLNAVSRVGSRMGCINFTELINCASISALVAKCSKLSATISHHFFAENNSRSRCGHLKYCYQQFLGDMLC